MSPLGVVDARDADLARRRFRLAAAAGSWLVTRTAPRRPLRPHAGRTLVELDTLLAFGVVPVSVGSDCGGRPRPWRAIAAEADVEVIDGDDLAMGEKLLDRGVDLAVVSDTLARVAPWETDVYGIVGIPVVCIPDVDVPGQLHAVGAALGMPERADTLAGEVRSRLRRFAPVRRPASITAFTVDDDGSVQVFTPESPLGELLAGAGLPVPTSPPGRGQHTVEVPPHEIACLDAEVTIGLETVAGALAAVETDPRFALLPVVRRGGYRRLDPVASYAAAVPSVLTVPVALDALGSVLGG